MAHGKGGAGHRHRARKRGHRRKAVAKWLGHHFPHELAVAILIASLVAILHHYGLFRGPDALFLRLATAFGRVDAPGPAGNPGDARGTVPEVVVLTEPLYERVFRQRSPLDRSVLARSLERLFPPEGDGPCPRRNVPGVLVVDLDLSPDPPRVGDPVLLPGPADPAVAAAEVDGDRRLEGLLTCLAGQTDLVLSRTIPVLMPGAREVKSDWQKRLCRAKVWFAEPYIVSIFDTVLWMDPHPETPARLAYGIQAGRAGKAPLPERPACNGLPAGGGLAPQASAHETGEGDRAAEDGNILNFNFARALDPLRIDTGADLDRARFKKEDVVFLGGDFGIRDKYLTPAGSLDGTYLHAAAFYSLHHPVDPWTFGESPLFDIVVGVLAGLLFTAIHEWFVGRESAADARLDGWKAERVGLAAFGALGLNLAAPVGVALVLMGEAAEQLLNNVWIHPVPMVIGMFLHSTLIRTRWPTLSQGAHRSSWDVRPWGSWTVFVVCAGVVAWALYLLTHEVFHG